MIKFLVMFLLSTAVIAAPDLVICQGRYALCAASPTTPTGKYIVIKGIAFQEGVSVCPVLTGNAVGDKNLIGSCKPPKGENTVWSLFSTEMTYPQAPSWAVVTAVPRTFVTTEKTGGMSNQWSYPCVVRPKQVNGVTLADCLGPLNESPWDGSVVPVGTSVVTSAPMGAAYPVGGNIPAGSK
jgi:hypothetical protein